MVSVGFNAVASVRVSNELGAGNPKSAAFSVVMVTLVSLTITVIKAIMVLALRHVINYVFTSGETVANAVSGLCPSWQSLSSSMESNQSCPVWLLGVDGKHSSHT